MPAKKNTKTVAPRNKAITAAQRAGIVFPPARMMRLMRRDRLNERIGKPATVVMAAVIDYLAQEILEVAGDVALKAGKKRIIPRHVKLALSNDEELQKVCANCVIHEGGVNPHIEEALFPKKGKGKGKGVT